MTPLSDTYLVKIGFKKVKQGLWVRGRERVTYDGEIWFYCKMVKNIEDIKVNNSKEELL